MSETATSKQRDWEKTAPICETCHCPFDRQNATACESPDIARWCCRSCATEQSAREQDEAKVQELESAVEDARTQQLWRDDYAKGDQERAEKAEAELTTLRSDHARLLKENQRLLDLLGSTASADAQEPAPRLEE